MKSHPEWALKTNTGTTGGNYFAVHRVSRYPCHVCAKKCARSTEGISHANWMATDCHALISLSVFSPGLWGTNGKNKSHTFISSKPYDFPKKVLYKLWQFATSLFAKTPGTSGWIRMRQATRIKTKSSWEVSERGKQWRYDDYDGDINGDIIGL